MCVRYWLASIIILPLLSCVPNLRVDANLGGEGDVRDGFIGVVFQLEGRLVLELLENNAHHTVNASDGVDKVYQ